MCSGMPILNPNCNIERITYADSKNVFPELAPPTTSEDQYEIRSRHAGIESTSVLSLVARSISILGTEKWSVILAKP